MQNRPIKEAEIRTRNPRKLEKKIFTAIKIKITINESFV